MICHPPTPQLLSTVALNQKTAIVGEAQGDFAATADEVERLAFLDSTLMKKNGKNFPLISSKR